MLHGREHSEWERTNRAYCAPKGGLTITTVKNTLSSLADSFE